MQLFRVAEAPPKLPTIVQLFNVPLWAPPPVLPINAQLRKSLKRVPPPTKPAVFELRTELIIVPQYAPPPNPAVELATITQLDMVVLTEVQHIPAPLNWLLLLL